MADLPFHPGAVRFYREIGIKIPDAVVPNELIGFGAGKDAAGIAGLTKMKLYSRPGNDLTDRFLLIVEAQAVVDRAPKRARRRGPR